MEDDGMEMEMDMDHDMNQMTGHSLTFYWSTKCKFLFNELSTEEGDGMFWVYVFLTFSFCVFYMLMRVI